VQKPTGITWRGIKLNDRALWWDTPPGVNLGVYSLEPDKDLLRLTLTNGDISDSRAKPGPNTAHVVTVSSKNSFGLQIHSWVFIYRDRLYYRIPGGGSRGQYLIRQKRWSTQVKHIGPILDETATWFNATVKALYENDAPPPIIADAMEEAGCMDDQLLANLRS
jgi:hypothetical protein